MTPRASRSQSVIEVPTTHHTDVSAALPNPNHLDTIQQQPTSPTSFTPGLVHSTSNSNLRPHTFHGRINHNTTIQPATSGWQPAPTQGTTHTVPQAPQLDLSKTDDVAVLKQEILNLRRKAAIYREERDSLAAILAIEKDFVRDRQNKLDSWEHFARLIVFKVFHIPTFFFSF